MTNRSKLIRRYPLLSFFVLSYLFFVVAILIIGAVVSLTAVSALAMGFLIAFASWTPNAAAFVVTGITEGREGVRRLFAGWLRWRISVWWYVFGLAPIGMAVIVGVLYSRQSVAELSASVFLLMLFFHTIQGASGEELGWRGFALPSLQNRFSPLVSALILGLVISGWHGLLHLVSPTGIPEWQFILLLVSYSIIITWAYNKSGGSVLIATIFHFSFNFSLELVSSALNLIPLERLVLIRLIIYTVIAVLLIIFTGKNLSKRGHEPRDSRKTTWQFYQ